MAEFARGLRVFKPREKAPDFVIADLIIQVEELKQWTRENEHLLENHNGAEQLRLQILESKGGKYYAAVNNYQKGKAPEKEQSTEKAQSMEETTGDDLPF